MQVVTVFFLASLYAPNTIRLHPVSHRPQPILNIRHTQRRATAGCEPVPAVVGTYRLTECWGVYEGYRPQGRVFKECFFLSFCPGAAQAFCSGFCNAEPGRQKRGVYCIGFVSDRVCVGLSAVG